MSAEAIKRILYMLIIAALFGLWQKSVLAGLFMFGLITFVVAYISRDQWTYLRSIDGTLQDIEQRLEFFKDQMLDGNFIVRIVSVQVKAMAEGISEAEATQRIKEQLDAKYPTTKKS